jgi:hypothetical protein
MEAEMGGAYGTHGREGIGNGVKISVRKSRGKRSSAITIGRRRIIIKWTINLIVECGWNHLAQDLEQWLS